METKILIFLAQKGGIKDYVRVSSREVAENVDISPQTAIRKLKKLKDKDLIKLDVEPNFHSIKIDEKGLKKLNNLYNNLKNILNKESNVIIGELVSGLGEGKYYISRDKYKKRFTENLGFDPYPGTLNIMAHFPRDPYVVLGDLEPIIVPGFKTEDREFGDVRCYKVEIREIEGAIVVPSRTHHPPRELEIIAPNYLRGKLNLEDGDEIKLEVK